MVVWLGRLLAVCDSSYIGTPLDGLAAKGMRELYRMFTSGLVMGVAEVVNNLYTQTKGSGVPQNACPSTMHPVC